MLAKGQAKQDRLLALQQKHRVDAESAAGKSVDVFLQNDLLAQTSVRKHSGRPYEPDPDLEVRIALDRAEAWTNQLLAIVGHGTFG